MATQAESIFIEDNQEALRKNISFILSRKYQNWEIDLDSAFSYCTEAISEIKNDMVKDHKTLLNLITNRAIYRNMDAIRKDKKRGKNQRPKFIRGIPTNLEDRYKPPSFIKDDILNWTKAFFGGAKDGPYRVLIFDYVLPIVEGQHVSLDRVCEKCNLTQGRMSQLLKSDRMKQFFEEILDA